MPKLQGLEELRKGSNGLRTKMQRIKMARKMGK